MEETLLSFSGNGLFKEIYDNITAILLEPELLARCVQHLAICTEPATAEQTSRFACLVDLFQACSNGEGQGADTQSSLHQCFCAFQVGGAEIAQLQEVNISWSHSETCVSSKLWG